MTWSRPEIRYLLLQVRDETDAMRAHEVGCFRRLLACDVDQIEVLDLLSHSPSLEQLQRCDMVLLGGSGDYSATDEEPWIERPLDALREIHGRAKPTFASCWGFQAMARALGGMVERDLSKAELGTIQLELTPAGAADSIFSSLERQFWGQAGHEDCVTQLPADAVSLATSARNPHQAYRFQNRPIYCTQFHPELQRDDLLRRVTAYPAYIARIRGLTIDQFATECRDTPETENLLRLLVDAALPA